MHAKELQSQGIQRYGLHGLSLESILRQLANHLPERIVIAYLGNGASVTAVKAGKSIDTSMGLTPTGGVIMGTHSGDRDPGVLVYLMREKKFDAAMLEDLVDRRSCLLGISDVSSDMRRLHELAPSNPGARLAIEMFCYALRKQIAAMIAALDGLDLLVFTGVSARTTRQCARRSAPACPGSASVSTKFATDRPAIPSSTLRRAVRCRSSLRRKTSRSRAMPGP